MSDAFFNTNLSTSWIFEWSDCEWKSWESLVNFSEESSSTLDFKVILGIEFSLKYGCSVITFLWFTLSWWNVYIKTNNITWGEFEFFNSLLWSLFIDDHIITINQVLLNFVWKNTFNWVYSEIFSNLCNSLGNLGVGTLLFNESLGSSECVVCSKNCLCFLSTNFCGGIGWYKNSMSSLSNESIKMTSKINLCNITLVQLSWLVLHGWVVSHDVVNWNTGWECDTSLQLLWLLVIEYFSQFFLHKLITFLTYSVDISTWNAQCNNLLKCVVGNLSCSLVFI